MKPGSSERKASLNIWLVSIFEQTPIDKVFSTRFISIAQEAVQRGHQVTFFGSTFKHNTKNQRFEETTKIRQDDNYRLVFIKSGSYQKNISLKRLWLHYRFSKVAVKEFEKYQKPDIILLAFPPVSLAYETSLWANKYKIPLILDIIDPWPDAFKNVFPSYLSFLTNFLFLPQQNKLRATLKHVIMTTAISDQYIDWANSYYDKIPKTECLYPAADFEKINALVEQNKEEKQDSSLNVIYAGSLARSYDIKCILEAADKLHRIDDIHFFIAGAGPQVVKIKEYLKNHQNLTYLGRLPKDELMKYYGKADLGLTQHIKGANQSVTYKLFDLLSAGLPILNSLESEMRDIIVNNKVGLHNKPGDSNALARNILFFYDARSKLREFKENGLQLAKQKGDTKLIYKRFVDILEENCRNFKE